MTDKLRAAAEMALEALNSYEETSWSVSINGNLVEQAQEALRQALDQLPDTTKMIEPSMGLIPSEWAGLEKSDIPIDRGAWADVSDATKWVDELRGDDEEPAFTDQGVKFTCGDCPQGGCCEVVEPPNSTTDVVEREWQGLTDDEIAEASKSTVEGKYMLPHSFARAIESALKTKNGF